MGVDMVGGVVDMVGVVDSPEDILLLEWGLMVKIGRVEIGIAVNVVTTILLLELNAENVVTQDQKGQVLLITLKGTGRMGIGIVQNVMIITLHLGLNVVSVQSLNLNKKVNCNIYGRAKNRHFLGLSRHIEKNSVVREKNNNGGISHLNDSYYTFQIKRNKFVAINCVVF